MGWRTTKMEDQRLEFITAYLENKATVKEICSEFCISRKTGYKWINRYHEEGEGGLKDRSRSPHAQAGKTSIDLEMQILEVKKKYSKWGPKKIFSFLEQREEYINWPSTTTIANILGKHGLIIPRKYRTRLPAKTDPLSHCCHPNDGWCIDFKGWFRTKDSVKCDPLTISDAHSRFLLFCSKISKNTVDNVWEVLRLQFLKNGLPIYLRHDNGPPFATRGVGRLSRLSVNLIKAGVIPEWIDPGKPYQNGRHERMHLTLKQEGIFPLKLTLEEQQMKFGEFEKYFNFERPHEALGQKTPGSVYVPSNRVWSGKLQAPEYPEEYTIKRVREKGQLSWFGQDIFVGRALSQEYVGMIEHESGNWKVYFGPVFLGEITPEKKLIQPRMVIRPTRNIKTVIY